MLASVAWRLIVPEARARSEVARSGEKRTRHLKHEEKKGKREPRAPRSGHRVELSGRPGVRNSMRETRQTGTSFLTGPFQLSQVHT